jgi:hypothetical protein
MCFPFATFRIKSGLDASTNFVIVTGPQIVFPAPAPALPGPRANAPVNEWV